MKPGPKRRTQPAESGRQPRSGRFVRLTLALVAVLVIGDAIAGERGLVAMLRARREYDQLAATVARQRADNARLLDEARRLRDDPATIEEVARRELGLIRPGEKVFIVKDIAPPAATPPKF